MRLISSLLFVALFFCSHNGFSQTDKKEALRKKIQYIIDTSKAHVGIGVIGLDFEDTLMVNGDESFPMQSVYKFPQAIAILKMVDDKRLTLTEKVHIAKETVDTATWSPMVKKYPNQNFDITVQELLVYSVGMSDNNACDVLFSVAGGTKPVHDYIQSLHIKGINIKYTEAEMKQFQRRQYDNSCKPTAMLQLLKMFYDGKLLTMANNDLLMKIMTEGTNSPDRIKGLLPANTIVAHKTGTSNTTKGITFATNDVGIITLPNGKHIAVAAFVSDYKGEPAKGERMIAEITKLVWDHYTK